MAKVKINWPPMSMKAEGEDAAVLAQAEQFLKYVKEAHKISFDVLPTIFRDGCRDPEELDDEDVEPLTEPEEVAPGAQWDVVAIYDNAGIPSIMHRFRRMNDKDLFRGGKDKPHPAPLACSTWASAIRAAIPAGASGAVPLISRNAESCSLASCEPSGSEAERKK